MEANLQGSHPDRKDVGLMPQHPNPGMGYQFISRGRGFDTLNNDAGDGPNTHMSWMTLSAALLVDVETKVWL